MQILVGRKAPDFITMAYYQNDFREIRLSDYQDKSWVVLFFYPGDFTFVCTTEIAALGVKYDDFQDLKTEIISVSIDTHFVHKMWDKHELSKMVDGGIQFPMCSDVTGKIGNLYGVFDDEQLVDIRGIFIIDPDGVIQAAEILSSPIGRDIEEFLRLVKACHKVRESEGKEATPAGWKPGQDTLTPSGELVGNVWKSWKAK